MTAIAIGAVVSLGAASIFTFGVNQFNIIVEQNQTEESLLLAAYYVRAYMYQAVKVVCYRDLTDPALPIAAIRNMHARLDNVGSLSTGTAPANDYVPLGVGEGKVDCRPETYTGNFEPGVTRPFAFFFREAGLPNPANVATPVAPDLKPTALYFCAPGGDCSNVAPGAEPGSGVLLIATGAPGVDLDLRAGLALDRLVDISVVEVNDEAINSVDVAAGRSFRPLRSMSVRIVGRYYKNVDVVHDYSKALGVDGGNGSFRDVEFVVPINFRNNWIRNNGLNAQRLYGELYFYQFSGPKLSDMRF